MLLNLNSALEDVRRELADAEAKQERLLAYIEMLKAEAHGLELALDRHSGRTNGKTATNGDAAKWRRLARTDAVLAVLHLASEALGPADITRLLHARGRDDKRDHVAAALAYLKRKGRVEHVGTGEWTVDLFEQPEAAQVPLVLEGGDAR